ncbi:MAG TPA: sigma-70 family RNA polymerase sigma factor [Kofleriaceae bacterium]|nr:sigma-70 family RNA polymerase sigma factor [Kofleriaceae bacterium]
MAPASDPRDAYLRYGPALVRKAERFLRNPDDAIDLVHGLFVDLIARPGTNVELPYLYRAVTNRCLNLIRDRRGRERLLEREQPALVPTSRLGDQARVIGLDLLGKLGEVLDEGQLEVLVCRYLDEMTQDEIADHLGLSRKTVGKRLARAHEAIAALTASQRADLGADRGGAA